MNCVFKINGTAPRTKSALLTGICLAKKLEWTLVTSEERWEIVSRVSEEESSIEAIVVRLRPSIRRGLKFYYTTFRKTRFDRDIVSMHLPFQERETFSPVCWREALLENGLEHRIRRNSGPVSYLSSPARRKER